MVEDALAAGTVAVAVACYPSLDVIIVDLGVEKSLNTCFKAELGIIDCVDN